MTHAWTLRAARALAAAALLPLGACGGDGASARPHVILITLDTVRADHLSCYGGNTGDTPALDGIASAGALFEQAISVSGLTPTSHATILTGRFQYEHGLRVLAGPGGYRLEDVPTLATALKAEGYRTGAVHSAFPVSSTFGFDEGFDHFDSLEGKLTERGNTSTKVGWDVASLQRRSDETTARALRWMSTALEEDDGPIFLWLHYWDPHDPVVLPPTEEFERLFYDEVETELRDESSRSYAAELRWQDQNLGALFRGLDGLGALDEALLAITSDHGQGLGDGLQIHGWGAHRMLYREQVHVPLLLRGPGVPAGARIPAQVRTADIAPTLLELAGLDPVPILGKYIAGESLVPLLDAGAPSGDRVAYGEQVSGYDDNAGMRVRRPDAAFLYMVSDGEWKVIYRPHMPENSELFHVSVDPRETQN
ncbi:MAG: sulfatase, partial [Planctomycetota bacterium]